MTFAPRAPGGLQRSLPQRHFQPDVALIAICGPTCSGKTTLARTLIARFPSVFVPVVTTTTRTPRPGESNDRDYHFIDRATFLQHISKGRMVEFDELGSNFYGLERLELSRANRSGRIGVIVCTPNGIGPVRAACQAFHKRVVTVFVSASPAELTSRLLQRFRADREDSVRHYAERLLQMLDSLSSWPTLPFDISEPSFCDATFDAVLDRIHHNIKGEKNEYSPTHQLADSARAQQLS